MSQLDLFGLPAEQTQAPATIPVRSYSRRAKATGGRKARASDFETYYDALERVQKYLRLFYPIWKSSRQVAGQAPCPDRWVLKALASLNAEQKCEESGVMYFRLAPAASSAPQPAPVAPPCGESIPVPPNSIPVPHNGTATSKAAAKHMEQTGKAQTQEQRILAAVQASGAHGMTREEIHNHTGISVASVCGRVGALLKKGLMSETGETRRSSAGVMQAVVVAKGESCA